LNAPTWKQDIKQYLKTRATPFSAIPRDVMAKYGGTDTYYTYHLFPILLAQVREQGLEQLYEEVLKPAQRCFAILEDHGTLIDQDYVEELHTIWDGKIASARQELIDFAREKGFKASDVVKEPTTNDLNPNSYVQLQYLFFDLMKMRWPKGQKTTGEVFFDVYGNLPVAQLLNGYRTAVHMMRTYVDGIADDIWADGRVHPDFLLFGTKTGRLSIQNPPLQTIPREELIEEKGFNSIKRLFIVPEGSSFVEADYSTLELWIAYHYSQDKNLGEALRSTDFHREVAAGMFNKNPEDVTSQERYLSKFVTFGLMYGRTAWTLMEDLNSSETEAQRHIDNYFEAFPDYADWWKAQQVTALETGVLQTTLGRKRRWNLITPTVKKSIENQAVNFPIQSLAGDQCTVAAYQLSQILPNDFNAFPLFMVHDSIAFEIPNEHLEPALIVIRDVMEEPKFETIVERFPVDFKVGPNWGDAKDFVLS